jgi:hypothetical protein
LREKTKLITDWLWLKYDWGSSNKNMRYRYVVTPNEVYNDEGDDEIQNAIDSVESQCLDSEDTIGNLNRHQGNIGSNVEDIQKKIAAVQQRINEQARSIRDIV